MTVRRVGRISPERARAIAATLGSEAGDAFAAQRDPAAWSSLRADLRQALARLAGRRIGLAGRRAHDLRQLAAHLGDLRDPLPLFSPEIA